MGIALFGAGRESEHYIDFLEQIDEQAICLIDNSPEKQGKKIRGLEILPPSYLYESDCDILISCSYEKQILDQLEKMGFSSRVVYRGDLVERALISFSRKYSSIHPAINQHTSVIIDAFDGVGWGGTEVWSYSVGLEMSKRGYDVTICGLSSQVCEDEAIEQLMKRYPMDRKSIFRTISPILHDLERNLPFVLLDNWSEYVMYAAIILKQIYPEQVRIISFQHNDLKWLYRKKNMWASYFDAIAGVSKRINRKLMLEYDVAPYKIFYKENFIKTERKSKLTTRGADEPLRISWAGRVEFCQKRIDLFPQLIECLNHSGIKYHLEIAGDGGGFEYLEKYVLDNGLEDRVSLLGALTYDDMTDFWSRQHIYINLSDYEGCSLAMLEAMSQGCVPVVTDTSGTDEFVYEDETGYRVPVADIGAMVEKIEGLFNNEEKRQEMSIKASQLVVEKCELKDYIDSLEYVISNKMQFDDPYKMSLWKDNVKLQFLCVGFQKCGTTSLHDWLINNRKLYLPKEKETFFLLRHNFESEKSIWNSYPSEKTKGKLVGGIEPLYFDRAKEVYFYFGPKVKIIFCMANPAKAAFSSFKMDMRDVPDSAVPLIKRYDVINEECFWEWISINSDRYMYAKWIKKFLEIYPKDQLFFLISEEMYREPSRTMNDLQCFINLSKEERMECASFPHSNSANRIVKSYPDALINNAILNLYLNEKDITLKMEIDECRKGIFEYTTQEIEEIDNDKLQPRLTELFMPMIMEMEEIMGRTLKNIWY